MRELSDHVGRTVFVPEIPKRIVSLCPSQTETLFALGLGSRVVGRTRFCVHPVPEIEAVPRIGGTKTLKLERVREAQPDLIIGEKEENTREMVEELEQEFPVFVMDVVDVASALRMVRDMGMLCGVPEKGTALAEEIASALEAVKVMFRLNERAKDLPLKVLYFIWRDPWMVAGGNTFIDSILTDVLGFENLGRQFEGRYPVLLEEAIRDSGADLILLSSEPYPFATSHISELDRITGITSRGPEHSAGKHGKGNVQETEGEQRKDTAVQESGSGSENILLVDGELFSWYGARMLEAPAYFKSMKALPGDANRIKSPS